METDHLVLRGCNCYTTFDIGMRPVQTSCLHPGVSISLQASFGKFDLNPVFAIFHREQWDMMTALGELDKVSSP